MSDALKELFSSKLGGHECPVDGALWSRIESAMPQAAAPAGTSTAVKGLALKGWVAAAAVVTVVVAGIVYLASSEQSEKSSQQVVQTSPAEAPETRGQNEFSEEAKSVELNNQVVQKMETANATVNKSGERAKQKSGADDSATALPDVPRNTHTTNNLTTGESSTTAGTGKGHTEVSAVSTPSMGICAAAFSPLRIDDNALKYFFIPECTDAAAYQWQFGDEEVSTEMSPSHVYTRQGRFNVVLQVTGANGQVSTTTREVKAWLPAQFNPTGRQIIFTPNGDGMNDEFRPMDFAQNFSIHRLFIFDLSNRKVYEQEGDNNVAWNGVGLNGEELPDGTYTAVVEGHSEGGEKTVRRQALIMLKR